MPDHSETPEHCPRPARDLDERLYVAVVAKALDVLAAFSDERAALSLTEIASRAGLGRSATQRLIYTLRTLGYMRQDPASRRYTLTPKLLKFANAALRNDPLIERAFPYLREASRRTGETVNLTRLDEAEVVFVMRFPSSTVISADLVLGSRLPAFCSAPGRAMLAHLDNKACDDILSGYPRTARTSHTIIDLVAIRSRLETIRDRGFEIAVEEAFAGDLSIAAPVHDEDGRVSAAVNIAVATPRWSAATALEHLAPIVTETATAISSGKAKFSL